MVGVVVDTNVIVSAALSEHGTPAKVIALIIGREDMQLYYCIKILTEYTKVLSRPRLNIPIGKQAAFIEAIIEIGKLIEPITSVIPMPDESDRIFYDTAVTSNSLLVTGNTKHFPHEPFVVTPSDFLQGTQGLNM